MDYDVLEVVPIGDLRLRVRFADGLQGEVKIHPSWLFGVFETLRDPVLFSQVHCRNGFVEWPGELDLAPETMHREIRAAGICIVTGEREMRSTEAP